MERVFLLIYNARRDSRDLRGPGFSCFRKLAPSRTASTLNPILSDVSYMFNFDLRAVGFTFASPKARGGYLSRGPRKGRRWTTHRLGCPPRERKRLTLAGTYLHRRGDDVPYFWKEMTHLLTEKKRRTLIIERNDVPWDIKRNDVPWGAKRNDAPWNCRKK